MNANVLEFPGLDVDRLGKLAAQIDDLQKQYDAIAQSLRDRGPGRYEGSLFAATVTEEALVQNFDSKGAKAKLLEFVDQSWIDANLVKLGIRKSAVKVGAR